jgi:hypothetical protein
MSDARARGQTSTTWCRHALALAVLAPACSRDIRLGDIPPDAPSDTVATTFIAGSYAASFLDPAQVSCQGTLAGHEADFASVTRASVNLVDGTVQLAGANPVVVSGAPVQNAFAQSMIALSPDSQAIPPTLWDGTVNGSFGSGPDSTTAMMLALELDSAHATDPSGIQGAYGRVFVTSDTLGVCSFSFGMLVVRN